MDGPEDIKAKWDEAVTRRYCRVPLDVKWPRGVTFTETEDRTVVARPGEGDWKG